MIIALKKYTMPFLAAVVLIFTSIFVMSPAVRAESADTSKEAVCQGLGAATGSGGECQDPAGAQTIDGTINSAINIISFIVGALSVFMLMLGGIKYVTSQGESASLSSAKNTIIYAIVGLIIVALSQTVVKFVIAKL